MTFKQNWEKTDEQLVLPKEVIENMFKLAFPDQKLDSYQIISGGCVNLNIKIQLNNNQQPFILRIYLRDKDAAYREKNISTLLNNTLPVPSTYYISDYQTYRFAITQFMPGMNLRDLLLGDLPHDVDQIMQKIGTALTKITALTFPKAGFFDKDLNIIEPILNNGYLDFAKTCLDNPTILSQLKPEIINKINFYLKKYSHLLPGENDRHLAHADFDPANILVNKINNTWEITGILDWEFSFSGSILNDVANMLRYAHHMPPAFEQGFLRGLKDSDITLPDHWRITVHLLNLSALMDCLMRVNPPDHPNRCADIGALINHILGELDNIQFS